MGRSRSPFFHPRRNGEHLPVAQVAHPAAALTPERAENEQLLGYLHKAVVALIRARSPGVWRRPRRASLPGARRGGPGDPAITFFESIISNIRFKEVRKVSEHAYHICTPVIDDSGRSAAVFCFLFTALSSVRPIARFEKRVPHGSNQALALGSESKTMSSSIRETSTSSLQWIDGDVFETSSRASRTRSRPSDRRVSRPVE